MAIRERKINVPANEVAEELRMLTAIRLLSLKTIQTINHIKELIWKFLFPLPKFLRDK